MTHHKQPVLLPVLALLLLLQAEANKLIAPSYAAGASAPPAVPCLPAEAAALLRLKRSFATTDASVRALASWRAGTDCCRWDGVRCGGHGLVTWLDLGGRGLQSATLDPAIFNLTSLRYLNLAGNDFSESELPSAGFERLTHLNLSNANFSGIIPAGSLGRLTNLVSIDLSAPVHSDKFVDYKYRLKVLNFETLISKLKNLRELRLDSAVIVDDEPVWCGSLSKYTPNLRVLSLPSCINISFGHLCESLSGLRSLAVLDLRYNSLTGPVPDFFANMSSLRLLRVSDNRLTGQFPSIILQHTDVVTVDLSRNPGLSGNLPTFPAGSRLENLLVGGTNFSGNIPSSIGNLKYLKELDLSVGGNVFDEIFTEPGFSGTLPSSIGNLRSLELLALSGFGLLGTISSWIGNLPSLSILELSNCGLSGSIPSSVGELNKLKEVTLSNCKFSGTVQLSLFLRLPHLSMLSLSNNNLFVVDGEDNSSLVYPRIKSLELASCGIDKLPRALRHLGDLRWLDISHNEIQGGIPQWAWKSWSGLHFRYLDLSHNNFTSFVGLETFLPFSVDHLDLSSNMFEGPIPLPQSRISSELDYSSNMFSSIPLNISITTYSFKASRNNLSGSILAYFCGVSNLQLLDLSHNNLTGPIPSCLMAGTLRVLNLKKNRLHGELPDNLDDSCTLQVLNFGDNEIRGKLPKSLAACYALEVVDIQNNQLSDSFPCWMQQAGLVVLVLRSNKFFGHVGSCFFPYMRILDIASNNFSGTFTDESIRELIERNEGASSYFDVTVDTATQSYQVTTELRYKGLDLTIENVLRTVVFLDVSNNNFYGSIPAAIGDLVSLNMLNMSHNSFTGPIPTRLGDLTQLESLDMSSNELSGEIPLELASLDFLAILNLSNNKLVGSIPESPHFMTFSNGSLLGNSRLCGPPLSKECINRTTQSVEPHHSKKNSVDVKLFLFSGIGFGVGFAIAIVVAWGIPIRKRS